MACDSTPEPPSARASADSITSEVSVPHNSTTSAVSGSGPTGSAGGDGQKASGNSPSNSAPPTAASSAPNPYGPLSVDERIFFADAIAIVRPISSEAGVLTVMGQIDDGLRQYSPVVQSRLEVIEYLKGEGESEIIVDSTVLFTYDSDLRKSSEQAMQTAESNKAAQISGLEGDVGVVFLRHAEYPDGVVDTRETAGEVQWRQYSPHLEVFIAAGNISKASTTLHVPTGSAMEAAGRQNVSIGKLRERIEAMESLLREGEGIGGWEKCIGEKLLYGNYLRTHQAKHGGDSPNFAEIGPLPSGQPADFTVHSAHRPEGRGYYKMWLTGEDARHFEILIIEARQVITPDFWATRNQETTYDIDTRATRPLPAGSYEIYLHGQSPYDIPCDFTERPSTWILVFGSTEDVLHEAFFDPVDIEEAIGADEANGVLQPQSFETEDSEVTVQHIQWQDGQATMELSPATDLSGHRVDFISLDGTVSLQLDFADATESELGGIATLTWSVCDQPWQYGDLLMLRLAEGIPDDGVDATNDSDC